MFGKFGECSILKSVGYEPIEYVYLERFFGYPKESVHNLGLKARLSWINVG